MMRGDYELADDPMRRMCSHCEARITHTYTHWANQHGEKVRYFCDACGMWEDRTLLYAGLRLTCVMVRAADKQEHS